MKFNLKKKSPRQHRKWTLLIGLFLLFAVAATAQTTVTGVVTNESGEPLIGASVVIENTAQGGITDIDGNFSVSVADANSTVLVFSYTGYQTKKMALNGQTNLSIVLAEGALLDEIVIVGYAARKKTEVTGAIASLGSENFNVGVISSPEQLLQAKIPGVRVTSSSGEPGAAVNVTIRGAGSLRSGNSPLYVIDGVALSNESITPGSANLVGSNAGNVAASKNPLNFLNPDDIESIDVLKDASATAIYGSRGSNGVILITTKKGKAGEGKLSYNGFVGTASIAKKIDLVGSDSGTDWQDEVTRSALSHNHNLAYSGGSDRASYRASVSVLDQEGLIDKSELKRYTARLNSQIFALPGDRLRLDMNLIGSHVVDNGIPRSDVSDTDGELITNTLSADPSRTVLDENGNFSSGPTNPVGYLAAWNDVTKTDRLLANMGASLRIIDGLKYQLNLGVDRSNATREQELAPNNLEGININNGSYNFATIEATNVLVENFLTYNKIIDKSNFDVLLGHAYQKFDFNSFALASSNFLVPTISASDDPGNATSIVGATNGTNPDGTREVNKLESVFARVNYSFDDTYMLTASIRADGSSKFGSNNRWGYFPAISAAWRISKSLNIDMLDDLRLRVGWGQTGNQEIPNKATQETFQVTQNGISRVREANPDLKWEVSSQFNVGIDFALADNKIYGNIDYFNKVNTDPLLLVDSEPPAVSQKWVNLPGEITNSGVEIFLGTQLKNTKNFSWNIDFNGTFTSNSVSFPDGREILTGVLSGRSINGTLTQIIRDGEELGSFYLPVDNGDGTTSTDREILGSGIPDFVYGFNNYLRYNDFDFSFNISGVAGNKIYNATDNFLSNFGGNVSQRIADADGSIPPGASSFFLEDGAFLRLNNLTIGYNLPVKNTTWMSRARIYVTGQNLFVLTDYTGFDPEVNTPSAVGGNLSYGIDFAAYPRARTFLIGVNIDFN
ncbi:MAG: SusC/RagA family TonB-linked outer membrane protein [Bacteroidota bacterium]